MVVAIADTHATLWYLYSDPRLGKAASTFIDDATVAGDHIGVSAITIAEVVYLLEKGRIPASSLNDLIAAFADPAAVLQHVPFDASIAMKMTGIRREDLPDLPDRIIGATALYYNLPVLSRDSRMRSSIVRTIW